MSGLIVLFWFVGQGEALRYFVSQQLNLLFLPTDGIPRCFLSESCPAYMLYGMS